MEKIEKKRFYRVKMGGIRRHKHRQRGGKKGGDRGGRANDWSAKPAQYKVKKSFQNPIFCQFSYIYISF